MQNCSKDNGSVLEKRGNFESCMGQDIGHSDCPLALLDLCLSPKEVRRGAEGEITKID